MAKLISDKNADLVASMVESTAAVLRVGGAEGEAGQRFIAAIVEQGVREQSQIDDTVQITLGFLIAAASAVNELIEHGIIKPGK